MRFALCAFGRMTGKIITMRAKCEVVPMDHYRLLQREKISSNAVLQIPRTSGTFAAQQTLSANSAPRLGRGQHLVCSGSKTALKVALSYVRSPPTSRRVDGQCDLRLRAKLGSRHIHSITSSARESTVGDTTKPIDLATLRLITNSNLVGCSIGRSPGFAPRSILSTYSAARRNSSAVFGP